MSLLQTKPRASSSLSGGEANHAHRRPVVLAARATLVIALLGVLAAAFAPLEVAPSIGGSDWISHGLAFAVLAVLSGLALPGRRLVLVWLGLAGLGVGIEILQATPAIGRGPSIAEAGWNALVAGVVLALMALGDLRARQQRPVQAMRRRA